MVSTSGWLLHLEFGWEKSCGYALQDAPTTCQVAPSYPVTADYWCFCGLRSVPSEQFLVVMVHVFKASLVKSSWSTRKLPMLRLTRSIESNFIWVHIVLHLNRICLCGPGTILLTVPTSINYIGYLKETYFICCGLISWQRIGSYKDGHRLVTVHIHSDSIMLPRWRICPLEPWLNFPLSHMILLLS